MVARAVSGRCERIAGLLGSSHLSLVVAAASFLTVLLSSPAASASELVWANYAGYTSSGSLGSADLDGSNVNNNFLSVADPVSVAVAGQYLFWANSYSANQNGGGETIGRSNLDGSDANQTLISAPEDPGQLAADSNYVYWGNYYSPYISRANLDGSNVDSNFIDTGNNQNDGVAVNGQYIYWSNFVTGDIGRANLDGSNPNPDFITATPGITDMTLSGGYIYFSNYLNGTIDRANLDGTNVNQDFITALDNPQGIVVTSSNIYWADEGTDTIESANLDGSNVDPDLISTGYQPIGLALAPTVISACGGTTMGLVSCWTGNGTADDSVGSNNGTWVGAPSYASGRIGGQAFNFDGSTNYVDIGDPASLRLPHAVTIDAWVDPTSVSFGDLAAVLSKWAGDNTLDSYGLYLNGTVWPCAPDAAVIGAIGVYGTNECGIGGGSVPAGEWSNLGMSYDSTTGSLTVYLDGVAQASTTVSGGINASDVDVEIGHQFPGSGPNRNFPGRIGDVSVYDRALSPSEMADLANPNPPTPPACAVTAIRRINQGSLSAGDQEDVTVQAPGGLASISNVSIDNGTVSYPAFASGATDSVVVTATKTFDGVVTHWSFDMTDLAGQTAHCG